MGYTIQQQRIVNRVAEMLMQHREGLRVTVVALRAELDTYPGIEELTLSKAQSYVSNLRNVLNKLSNNSTVISAAADALDPDAVLKGDFQARFTALSDAAASIETATKGNIGSRLQNIIDTLPQEPQI